MEYDTNILFTELSDFDLNSKSTYEKSTVNRTF